MASFSSPDESSHTMIRMLTAMPEVEKNKYLKPGLELKALLIQQSVNK